jgi:hypothetical protein
MTTALFQAFTAADAAWNADELNLDLLRASDAAYAAYMAAVAATRAEWNAIPEGNGKFSAEINAHDTEGTDIDELFWLEIAIRTYEINGEE